MVPELTVSDFDVSLEFYAGRLGFKTLFSRPGFTYLDFEGAQLMLEEFHDDGWNVAALEKPYGRGINLQIECSDAGRIRDNLARFGCPLYREMEDAWRDTGDTITGSRELLVQDPDGYLLRFTEHLGEHEKTVHRADPEGREDV